MYRERTELAGDTAQMLIFSLLLKIQLRNSAPSTRTYYYYEYVRIYYEHLIVHASKTIRFSSSRVVQQFEYIYYFIYDPVSAIGQYFEKKKFSRLS